MNTSDGELLKIKALCAEFGESFNEILKEFIIDKESREDIDISAMKTTVSFVCLSAWLAFIHMDKEDAKEMADGFIDYFYNDLQTLVVKINVADVKEGL